MMLKYSINKDQSIFTRIDNTAILIGRKNGVKRELSGSVSFQEHIKSRTALLFY